MNTAAPFSIDQPTEALLAHMNSTTELEGEGRSPAADLKLIFTDAADMLADLHPSLRSFLYKKSEDGAGDLADQGSDTATIPRFPALKPFDWDLKLERYTLTIDHGLGGKSNIVLGEVTVSNFVIEAKPGGIVHLTMKVRAHPDPNKQAGWLYGAQAKKITVLLTPPDEDQNPLDGVH